MSGPEFERVLGDHLSCSCPDLLDVTREAHLSAALRAEVVRWLGDEGTREVARRELIDSGASPGSSLHSWRCEYPERYGSCDCVAETARDVLAALAALTADAGTPAEETP